jgi:hypothetical protein
MESLPVLTADTTWHEPFPHFKAFPQLVASGCSAYWMEQCVNAASDHLLECMESAGRAGLGELCASAWAREMATCRERWVCPEGKTCRRDERPGGWDYPDGIGTCCGPTESACERHCVPACPRRQQLSPNCGCECESQWRGICYPPEVWEESTCGCYCPPKPCFDGAINPDTCECECPDGWTYCDPPGICVDLNNDPLYCGSCDATPCDVIHEKCCGGKCSALCTDENCRDCGDKVAQGQKCCKDGGSCRPTQLGTDTNCSDCGDKCTAGRMCTNGQCQCPPGSRMVGGICCPNTQECCNDAACGAGRRCCSGRCVDTSSDNANCGSCGNACTPPRTCCSGRCVDTSSDNANCGRCGNPCDTAKGEVCTSGVCGAPCGVVQVSGGNVAVKPTINLGSTPGWFQFSWENKLVPDRLILRTQGKVIHDTGCVSYNGAMCFWHSGTPTTVEVEVIPNCSGTPITEWAFLVTCPTFSTLESCILAPGLP